MRQLSLTRFELYKVFSRKSVWIFFVIMIFGIVLPIQFSRTASPHPFYYQSTYPKVQQVLQAKTDLKRVNNKIDALSGGGAEFWKLLYDQQRDQAIIDTASGTAVQARLDSLQQTIRTLKSHGVTGYSLRVKVLEYSMLKHLPFIGDGNYFGAGAEIIDFIKTLGLVIFGAMIAMGLSPVFSEEYAIGSDSLLMTTKRGRRQLVTAKLLASVLYVLTMEVLLVAVNLICNVSMFNHHGFDYPLQSIGYSAPFHLTIGAYIVVAVVIQLLGGIAFSMVTLLLSSWNRSSLVAFFIAAGILAVPELVSKIGQAGWTQTVMDFSYTGLIQVSRLFQGFIAYNVFGYPVLYPILVIGLAILVSIPIVWLTYRVYCSHQI